MTSIDKLQGDFEKAEAKLFKLGNEYDDAKAKLRERFQDRLAKASEEARDAQKALADAQAAQALADRDDLADAQKRALAGTLRLELPE